LARDVAITGMGVVSCAGNGVAVFWDTVAAGRCELGALTRLNVSEFSYPVGGEVRGFDAPKSGESGLDLAAQFLLAACREALGGGQANLESRHDCAIIAATNFGSASVLERFLADAAAGRRPPKGALTASLLKSDAESVALKLGLGGPKVAMSLSCASGNAAIIHAAQLVRDGVVPVALAAGYDAISRYVWSGLGVLRVMSQKGVVRPFDRDRSGTLFSEGAGALVLESREHAAARGARVMALFLGGGMNNNAYHMAHSQEDGQGIRDSMLMALEDAGLSAEQIDHVNAHGTATKLNDPTETRAIKAALGQRALEIPVNSIKGTVGHGMGAAGSFEAIASIMALREGIIPPTINFETPDPECDLDCVPNMARRAAAKTVISNSAGIGGCNCAVIFASEDFR